MLFLAEVDLVLEKQGCKKIVLGFCCTDCVEIVFALLAKVITLYMQVSII